MTEEIVLDGKFHENETKNDMIEEKNLTKLLRVNFTSKEKLDMGDQMANAIRNIKSAEEDLSSVSSQYKSDIKKYQAELSSLAERLNCGWEMRSVNCIQHKDYTLKSVFIQRLDTRETIEERAMTADELQMGLPLIPFEGNLPDDINPFYIEERKEAI